MTSQEEVKNSIGNPSGYGALFLGIENVVALIYDGDGIA